MNKRITIFCIALFIALVAFGDPLADALEAVPAPGGEFVRMPAKYIIQKLETAARNSGDPSLGGFNVDVRMEDAESTRINLTLDSMNLLEALEAVAAATGARLECAGTTATLVDPATRPEEPEPAPEEIKPEEVGVGQDGDVGFSDVDSALVFVTTDAGKGSAFVAEMDGEIYVFSNQHNFMGARKIELQAMHGGVVEIGAFEFNRTRDLVRFKLKDDQLADLGVLRFSTLTPTIDENVVVYGNSAGGGVATELRGKVLGVGPREVEIDAKIVSGNSGSPIINGDGQVIGVATYITFDLGLDKDDAREKIFKGTRFDKPRRYGVRVPIDGWVEVDPRVFLAQTHAQSDLKNLLYITQVLVQYWSGDEEYAAFANRIMDSYGSRDHKMDPLFKFSSGDMEEEARMLVKAFKRNYEEFVDLARAVGSDKRELAKLGEGKSSLKIERVDYHIRTSTLSRVKRARDELENWSWMSSTLKDGAEPLKRMIDELIRTLEREDGIKTRVKAVL